MRLVRDVITDVVQQGGRGEQSPMMAGEIGGRFALSQLIEDPFSQLRDLPRVRLFITKAAADSVNAAQPVVGDVGDGWARLSFDLAQTINQHALAQSPAASAQDIYTKRAHRTFQ